MKHQAQGLSPALSSILLLLPCSEQTLSTLPLQGPPALGRHSQVSFPKCCDYYFMGSRLDARLEEVGLLFRQTARLKGSTVKLGGKGNAGEYPKAWDRGCSFSPLLLSLILGVRKHLLVSNMDRRKAKFWRYQVHP